MAIQTRKSEHGDYSGKVGATVYSTWKKKGVAKAAPGKRRPWRQKVPTPQNVQLALMSHFLAIFKDCLKTSFYKKYGKNPGYQNAIEYNVGKAIKEDAGKYSINFSDLVLSIGNREIPWATRLSALDDKTILVSWEIPETAKLSLIGKDAAHLLYYGVDKDDGEHVILKEGREKLSLTQVIHGEYRKGPVHFWLYFSSSDGKDRSNSKYLGELDLSKAV